ncbi:hypothetical protein ACJX0J_021801, partial [Zea mays]
KICDGEKWKKAKNEEFGTDENDMVIDMITTDKTGKLTEVIKDSGEKEGSEGDMTYSVHKNWMAVAKDAFLNKGITSDNILIEMADLLNKDILIVISDSIDKMVHDLFDRESEKEKIKIILQMIKKRETADLMTKIKEFDQRQDISEFMINCLIHHNSPVALFNSIIEMSNPTKKKVSHEDIVLEVEKILIFGKKKKINILKMNLNRLDIQNEIHALYDNGRLVDNEEEINKEFLTAPFSLKRFIRLISGILLKMIFGTCNQFGFVKEKYILDCVVALHEIIHEVAIRTNGMIGPYFPTHKGLMVYCFGNANNNKDAYFVQHPPLYKETSVEWGACPYVLEMRQMLSLNKEINVNWVLRDNCNSLTFRKRLFGVGANLLEDLKNDCAGVFSEKTILNKNFSLKSDHYWMNDCCFNNISPSNTANIEARLFLDSALYHVCLMG